MTNPFIQLHFLTSYPASLLNRDDVGFAKRIPFGGAVRIRVSSQCLKRHWRTHEGEHAISGLGVPMSVRSRLTFDRYVKTPLIAEGVSEEIASAVVEAIMPAVLGESAKAKKAKGEEKENGAGATLQTGQITVLGRPEVDFLLEQARILAGNIEKPKDAATAVKKHFSREMKQNLQALRHAAGLDAALFGRMVTSDALARGDAALHVAHAFTVHEEAAESDYFSAVDDLARTDKELGSGHIGSAELTSGLFYGYVVVDVPLLVSNLEGCERQNWADADRTLASQVVERLVHLLATVSPGAKLGSTAPHAYAHLVLAEVGSAQPRTLANAFLEPVRGRDGTMLRETYRALDSHVAELDEMYGVGTERRIAALGPKDSFECLSERGSLREVSTWISEQVRA